MIIFKSIKPATQFKSSSFRQELRAAAEAMAPKIQKDFQKTTRTWKHKVEFTRMVTVGNPAGGSLTKKVTGSASGVSVEVSTDDEIYGYVDEGTRKHVIKARRAPYLQFRYPTKAKTKPRVIGSTAGKVGNNFASRKQVMHPGTAAREFSKTIRVKWTPQFRKEMDAALKRAAKQSGHSINSRA